MAIVATLGQSGQTSQPLCGSMSGLFELREEVWA
jgi:hypothetical protein